MQIKRNAREAGWKALLLGMLLTLPAMSQTCYVSLSGGNVDPFDSWAKAATTIQPALQAAATNGWNTVLVATGTYNLAAQVAVTNALTLRSWNNGSLDPENTILDGGGAVRCLLVSNAAARVEGFTLTRGGAVTHGAGTLMYYGLLDNCILTYNGGTNLDVWGGGACLYQTAAIVGSRIIANASGPGVSAGGVLMNEKARLADCIIAFNTNIHVSNISHGGGGIMMSGNTSVENCRIISNFSISYGAGIYTGTGANSTNIIRNCLIAGNQVTHSTGGAGITMVATGMDKVTLVQNCTIVSNFSPTYAGGIYCRNPAGNMVENSIVYNNNGSWAQKDYYYSSTAGGTSFWTNCCTSLTNYFSGSGNTTNAPVYVNFDECNYRLPGDSFLVNAGMPREWMGASTDLDGHRRIDRMSGLPDIGCYEFIPQGAIFNFR